MRNLLWSFVAAATFVLAFVAAINVVLDPYWYFGINNKLNRIKYIYDERAQKTNLIAHRNITYNSILIGSSRTTYINQTHFKHGLFFNYAVAGIYPWEYGGYVRIAKKQRKISTVVIGLDFYGDLVPRSRSNDPRSYLLTSDSYEAITRNLFSTDGLWFSWKAFCRSIGICSLPTFYYDNEYVKRVHLSLQGRNQRILSSLENYQKNFFAPSFRTNKKLRNIFDTLISANKGIKFIVFTTPISYPLFALMIKDRGFEEYAKWIRLVVSEFGSVYDFMGMNSVTTNLNDYQDAAHFYPRIGDMIIDRIEGQSNNVPADFGVLVNASNIDKHIANMRTQALYANKDPIATFEKRVAARVGS
jgi:hypothetical protein